MFLLLKLIVPLEMSNEVRLFFNVVGGIGALVIPIAVYSLIESKLTYRAVKQVSMSWCQDQNFEFEKVEIYKNHFALMYSESGKKLRRKFRVRFIPTTWYVRSVEWLDK